MLIYNFTKGSLFFCSWCFVLMLVQRAVTFIRPHFSTHFSFLSIMPSIFLQMLGTVHSIALYYWIPATVLLSKKDSLKHRKSNFILEIGPCLVHFDFVRVKLSIRGFIIIFNIKQQVNAARKISFIKNGHRCVSSSMIYIYISFYAWYFPSSSKGEIDSWNTLNKCLKHAKKLAVNLSLMV